MQAEIEVVQECETPAERGPGRPPIITLPVVEKIARLIAKGMTEEQACTRVGVNHSSFRTARHRNEEFETAIKRAQAEFLDSSLDTIGQGRKGWQGRAWILERRNVNKTSTCAMLLRRPTGVQVKCQATRQQGLNRFIARRLLLDKIEAIKNGFVAAQRAEREKIRRQKCRRSRRAKERMLADKSHHADKKAPRRSISPE